MPIPNISTLYQRIAKGSEGGHEFARFIKLLLQAHYSSQGINLISGSDASGDYKKLDAYIPEASDTEILNTGFQFKFFPCALSASQRAQIIDSIEAALKEPHLIYEFILVTPEDFMKEQQLWFDKLRNKYESEEYKRESKVGAIFHLIHWGHTKIIELALKHDHIGQHYFPELYPVGVGKFKLSKATIDCHKSNWTAFENEMFAFHQSYDPERNDLTTDPLFDFHFTNSSPEIFLLKKIEIHLEDVCHLVKGIPAEYLLKSIGTIEHNFDFKKRVNVIELNDPMIFPAASPMRFQIQLTEFTKKCPGNTVRLKFWFYFDKLIIPTDSFYLSF